MFDQYLMDTLVAQTSSRTNNSEGRGGKFDSAGSPLNVRNFSVDQDEFFMLNEGL